MTIHLKPELEALIQKDVERGPYQSVDEFVERAVQMLHEEEALLANDSQAIREKIERAFCQFERDEGLTPEESRARLDEKKRPGLSNNPRERHLVSPEANSDVFEIWRWIAKDSVELADRVAAELDEMFETPGRMPGQGHRREDLTSRPVLFFPLYSYLIVYQPDVDPIRIMAVLRGTRNVKGILKER